MAATLPREVPWVSELERWVTGGRAFSQKNSLCRAWRSELEGALGRPGSWPREPCPDDRAGRTLVVGGQCGRGAGDGRRVPVGGLEEQAAPAVGRCRWGGRVQPPTAWRGHPEAGSAGRHPVQCGVRSGGRSRAGRSRGSAVRPQDVSASGPREVIRWKMDWGCWCCPPTTGQEIILGEPQGPRGGGRPAGRGAGSGLWNPVGGWGRTCVFRLQE